MSILGREDLIVEGFGGSTARRAKYFTVNVGVRIGPDYHTKQLFLEISYNNDCNVYVHDPRFFTMTSIPVALPALKRQILVNTTESHFYALVMTEVEELELAQDPCNNAEKYNFQVFLYFFVFPVPALSGSQACVSKSITDILGCQPKWEPLAGDTSLPKCTTVAQFR